MRAEARHVAQSLRTFGPARGKRWPLALQAALAMTVPIVVLAALGYDRLALLAATGAFTVIYGGWLRRARRDSPARLWRAWRRGVLAAGGLGRGARRRAGLTVASAAVGGALAAYLLRALVSAR
ncbi:MAG: hypothetical protein R2723_02920 [Microbacterium sp.]